MPLQSVYIALYLFHSSCKSISLKGDLENISGFSLSFLFSNIFTAQ